MSKKILSLLLGLRIQGGASSFVINSSSSAVITERTSVAAACSYSYYKHSNSQIANNNSNLNFQSSRALFGTSSSDDATNKNNNNSNMSDEVAAAKAAAAEYKSSDADGAGPETAFDNILSGKWPSTKVYEDSTVLAFRDINPQAPTHIIVIPKHRDGLTKLSNAREDQEGILGHLLFVAQSVGRKECPEGFRVVVNDGEQGAQSVYHLHLHVLGGRQMGWPPG
mmetsp:Transcript_23279/g.39748  ORF Transcript_23279/g.39748 Transcript_23279/m.39748 type:complete len:224 (-) Transcript_23279:137-808(-)